MANQQAFFCAYGILYWIFPDKTIQQIFREHSVPHIVQEKVIFSALARIL